MPYVLVRGSPGVANTKVYGLPVHEAHRISQHLRPGPVNDQKDELTFYNSPVYLMNQLEYHFGYRVVACGAQGESLQPVWTLARSM